jgi:dephospho-CoA kinase
MGKSTAADWLGRRGCSIIDTDIVAREIVEPGQPALAEIRSVFGEAMVDANGQLRRSALAERVFADPEARRKLESILHPRIRAVWQARMVGWSKEGREIAVVVIPLLFETEAAPGFAATICIACSAGTQFQRLRARGWTEEQIRRRNQAQWPIEKKMAMADYVAWSEGRLEVLEGQLGRIQGSLQSREFRSTREP